MTPEQFKNAIEEFHMIQERTTSTISVIKPTFNAMQRYLLNQAYYGTKNMSKEDLSRMNPEQIIKIEEHRKKAQYEINKYKQNVIIQITNHFFQQFNHSDLAKGFIENHSKPETNIKDKFSFKDLGISEADIAMLLVKKNILPKNFFNLV